MKLKDIRSIILERDINWPDADVTPDFFDEYIPDEVEDPESLKHELTSEWNKTHTGLKDALIAKGWISDTEWYNTKSGKYYDDLAERVAQKKFGQRLGIEELMIEKVHLDKFFATLVKYASYSEDTFSKYVVFGPDKEDIEAVVQDWIEGQGLDQWGR